MEKSNNLEIPNGQKCEKCSMVATHAEIDTVGISHYYCGHHNMNNVSEHSMRHAVSGLPSSGFGKFKEFLPLIIAFILVIAWTVWRSLPHGGFHLHEVMQDFMAGFFIVFGLMKALSWKGFVTSFRRYDPWASKSSLYAYAYPAIELTLGLFYYYRLFPILTNLVTLVIMGVGAVGINHALHKKDRIECACLGSIFKVPLTKFTLFENLLMACMALLMLFYLI